MKKFLPIIFSVLFLLTACGGESDSANDQKVDQQSNTITEYAKSNGSTHAPNIQDYIDVGVQGVTSDNLTRINQVVKDLTEEDVDTSEEIQAILDDLGIVIPALDTDKDGVIDSLDNCPNFSNADQKDTDGDDIGDVCDTNDEVTTKDVCSDGVDNDKDGLTDFPDDPGCSSVTDNDEYNVPPATGDAPTISSLSGSFLDGQQITITGNDFGVNGPNVAMFDDFKRGNDGDLVTMDAPVGRWKAFSTSYPPHYKKDDQGNVANGGTVFTEFDDVQEIFISYRVKIPTGKNFPYSFAPNTFPPGSHWKLTWLMDSKNGNRSAQGNDDLCIPTWGNGTYFAIGGNDNAYQLETGRATNDTRWFSFRDWNRYSVYMKGGKIPDKDPGLVWTQGMSHEFGQKIFGSTDRRLFDGDDTPDGYNFEDDAISQWNYFKVPGWKRSGDDNAETIYDDIYIAIGAHARARIEIGNAPNYDDSTILAITTPTAWQDNAITTTIRQGGFKNGETAYLFVIDENGKASNGSPFVVGSTIP